MSVVKLNLRNNVDNNIILNIPKVEEDLHKNTSTSNLGIGLVISLYISIFFGMYTSHKTRKRIGSSVLSKGKKNFTLSQSFYDSEKYLSVFFLSIFLVLSLYVSYKKNLFHLKFDRIFIILSFIVIFTSYISIMYIGPGIPFHYIIALVVFGFGIAVANVGFTVYDKYYLDNEDNILNTYYQFMIVLYIFSAMLGVLFMYKYYVTKYGKNFKMFDWLMTDLLAIGEYIYIAIVGILLYIFSTFPKLPDP